MRNNRNDNGSGEINQGEKGHKNQSSQDLGSKNADKSRAAYEQAVQKIEKSQQAPQQAPPPKNPDSGGEK
jgi:hypothetical protein